MKDGGYGWLVIMMQAGKEKKSGVYTLEEPNNAKHK
jgi:hypothetical protein